MVQLSVFALFLRLSWICFFAHSNLDMLFKGALNNKICKKFDNLFDFALEGLEELNYRKTKIQSPKHHTSFHKINLKTTIISGEVLKDLPITLNSYFSGYSIK